MLVHALGQVWPFDAVCTVKLGCVCSVCPRPTNCRQVQTFGVSGVGWHKTAVELEWPIRGLSATSAEMAGSIVALPNA